MGNEDVGKEVEFSIMVIGGVNISQEGSKDEDTGKGPVAQGPSGDEVLGSEEFWGDLKGFLIQRVRDEEKAGEMWEVFKEGWRKRREG